MARMPQLKLFPLKCVVPSMWVVFGTAGVFLSAAVIAASTESPSSTTQSLKTFKKQDKIPIDRFLLSGFKPFPDLGWTEQKVQEYLDAQLLDANYEFTVAELDTIARQLSIQMKQAGLMFSRALVLEQEVKNKTLEITFEDGLLGEVVVMDAERTQPTLLARPFLPYLQTTAVRHELDKALYQLDRLPGIDVFGFFSFTDTPGLSRLNLRVTDEMAWNAFIHTDNYGSESLGRERVHATLDILNPTGWGDQLKLNVGRSYSQPGFFEGYVQYTVPIGANYQPLQFLVSNTDFNLGQGFESLEVFGQSTLASVTYRHQTRIADAAVTLRVGGSLTESRVDSLFYSNLFLRDSSVAVLDLGASYGNLLSRRLSQNINLGFRTGEADETSVAEGGGQLNVTTEFASFSAQYRLVYFHPDDSRNRSTTAELRAFGAADPLPSIEQTGFGGRQGIRGVPSGYFSADTGLIAHVTHDLELWPADWPGRVQLNFDIGLGQRSAVSNAVVNTPDQTAQFASVGFGYAWEKKRFQLTYEFGKVIHANLDNDTLDQSALDAFNDNTPSRHYLSLSYDLGEQK